MKILEGLYYTEDHEWVKIENNRATIGITDYAQDSMGDIVFVELPSVDDQIDAKDQCGVLESVKAAADVYMPISGRVVEINEALEDTPEFINESPYEAYLFIIEDFDVAEVEGLMDHETYKAFCAGSE